MSAGLTNWKVTFSFTAAAVRVVKHWSFDPAIKTLGQRASISYQDLNCTWALIAAVTWAFFGFNFLRHLASCFKFFHGSQQTCSHFTAHGTLILQGRSVLPCFLLAVPSRSAGAFCALKFLCRLALAWRNFSLNVKVVQELHAHKHTHPRGSEQLLDDNNNSLCQLQE